jgi:hypothetical protein
MIHIDFVIHHLHKQTAPHRKYPLHFGFLLHEQDDQDFNLLISMESNDNYSPT